MAREPKLDELAKRLDSYERSADRVRGRLAALRRALRAPRPKLVIGGADDSERVRELEEEVAGLRRLLTSAQSKQDAAPPPDKGGALAQELSKAHATIQEMSQTIAQMNGRLQAQLMELDQLRSSRKDLNRLVDEWRTRARALEKDKGAGKSKVEQARDSMNEAKETARQLNRKVKELEARCADQERELATAERRMEHLRQKLSQGPAR